MNKFLVPKLAITVDDSVIHKFLLGPAVIKHIIFGLLSSQLHFMCCA